MLYRTIRIINPGADYSISSVPDFPDQKDIDSWAVEGAKYMWKLGIIKGDAKGYFMPKATTAAQRAAGYGTATREAAVLMSVRTYDAMASVTSPSIIRSDSENLWSKYMSADGNISFYYPKGWNVGLDNSMIAIENPAAEEKVSMIMISFDRYKSPQDLAKGFLSLLQNGYPDIRASNWRSRPESSDIQVSFDLTNNYNGKDYSGLGIVIKSDQEAIWFSYFAPASGYHQVRGANILQGFIESLVSGNASNAPDIDYSVRTAERIDRNADAFMFVLEFALGAPFTQSQENEILFELKDGCRLMSEAELQEYDQYPALMQSILKMGQKDLEELRSDLEKSVREWLAETDQSDNAAKVINNQLRSRGQVVIGGEPPLTEMSLTAYSEIIAYSRLLQQNPAAKPEQISQESVNEIKQQVIQVWESFSITEREDIATTPGLWVCLRVLLRNGSQDEQDKIKANLKKLEAVTRDIGAGNGTDSKTSSSTGSGAEEPMDMNVHMCLMQMQQQTFNNYMWTSSWRW
ncbi:MAG: hypothetical protein ACM3XR_11295 [Bacillota bacterium]